MKFISFLPHLNAVLNSISSIFLVTGVTFILRQRVKQHRACMIAAFTASTIFLASYLTYHSLLVYYLGQGPTHFRGEGWVRPLYFIILTSHTILAIVVAPLVIFTLIQALRGRFDRHRRIARITAPLWLYVSVTGVIVYLMLYQIYPSR
jgi:putative membrane protein